MSHKHFREEGKINASKNLAVVSKCLAIVLIPKTRKNSLGEVLENEEADETVVDPIDGNIIQSSEVRKGLSPGGYSGKELLQDFKIRNKTCYWNPSLVESIKSLECKGFVEPYTILVTGADIHLENLRSAWARRVLKAPAGFLIERIGDVNGIEMQVIPQTHFIPLPDALCSIIMDLNTRRLVATLEMIWEKLMVWYKDMTVPSQQLVFDTLGSLIRERKVFHTGSGYFVVTPDTNRLQNSVNTGYLPTNASWLPYHPMYVPVFQGQAGQQQILLPSRAHMRSISCQVTTIEESSEEESAKERKKDHDRLGKASSDTKSSRSDSLKRRDGKDDIEISKVVKRDIKTAAEDVGNFRRSASLKIKGEKAKAPVEVKPSSVNQEKKGEKTSIFSKLFSRKKKHKDKDKVLMPPPPSPPPPLVRAPTTASSSDTVSEGKGEKEYGTFSAQFPPPEWVWYHQQLEKQKRTETWISQQSIKVVNPTQAAKVTARPPTGVKHTAANEYPEHISGASIKSVNPLHIDYIPMRAVNSQDKVIANSEIIKQTHDGNFVKPHPIRPENFYESFRNPSGSKHCQQHRKSRDFERADEDKKHHKVPSEYAVIDQGDTTSLHDSNVYHSVSALSPVAHLNNESIYAKLVEQPKVGPLHSTPRYEGQSDRLAYGVEGHESRDRIYGPPDYSQKRKSHRTRRRPQKVYSYYDGNGDDISYEYKGRLPNKNSSRAQSRDSGVNCVGLAKTDNHRHTGPVYKNTSSKHPDNLHLNRNSYHPHSSGNHVHFEVNNTAESEQAASVSALYLTDFVTNSVTYESDVTNPAYNSVVYGSNVTDTDGGPSVLYHTITESALASSEMSLPQNSLQSAFYSEDGTDLTSSSVIMCKAEINPKASEDVVELHGTPETTIVDVVGSPEERDVTGASESILERVTAKAKIECVSSKNGRQNKLVEIVPYGADVKESWESDHCVSTRASQSDQGCEQCCQTVAISDSKPAKGTHSPSTIVPTRMQNVVNGRDHFVSDSGFCSPRNPEILSDRKGLTSNQSNSASENSDGLGNQESHQNTDSSNTNQSSTKDSSDRYSNSDVYMTTGSEHQNGSTNDNGHSNSGAVLEHDSCKQTNSQQLQHKVKQNCIQNSVKSHSHVQQSQPLPQYHFQHPQKYCPQHHQNSAHHYQPPAMVVPHPDVYNNNTANTMHIEQNRQIGMPVYSHSLNHQKPHHKQKYERPRSVDLWRSNTPSDLHKFEEEQLSKKYGANGEFEVMGVL